MVKNLPANAGDLRDMGLIPGLGRSPGDGHSNLHQYSCLENPMDRGAWWATVHRVAQSRTRLKQLSMAGHIVDLQAFLVAQWFKKNPPANAGDLRDMGLIPGLGRSPGGGHGNSLQFSCLENPMDRGAWQATVQWGRKRVGHN